MSTGEIDRMWSLSFLDQARLLERKLGSVEALRQLIVEQVLDPSLFDGNNTARHKRATNCCANPVCL